MVTRTQSKKSDLNFSTDPELLLRNIKRAKRLERSVEKPNVYFITPKEQITTEENDISGGTDYKCCVCIQVAKEPVVTSCSHLFCWPCLYQWLHHHHHHGHHKECPVCKGKVSESTLVPIYGKGNSEAAMENKNGEDKKQGSKIPPRPKANRVESLMHESSLRRPVLIRSVTSWTDQSPSQYPQRLERRRTATVEPS